MRPQPRMQSKKAYERSHHGHTGFTRHSPRNGFNGFLRDLPGDRLYCHRHWRSCLHQFDASVEASGPPSASIASRPAFVTIASRPSLGRDSEGCELIWVGEETEIFLEMGLDR